MASPSVRQLALGDLEQEIDLTRRVLERLPDESLAWKPHERSWSLGSLAAHLTTLLFWQITVLQADEFDLAGVPADAPEPPKGREGLLELFDTRREELFAALDGAGDDVLTQQWTLRRGDQVLLRKPRAAVLRTMGISHMVHHRAQLGVYLRLLDVPVPGLYGFSADERTGS